MSEQDFISGDKDDVSDGTLMQSDGQTLRVTSVTSAPFIYKASWKRWVSFQRICFGGGWQWILVNKWIF